MKTIFIVFVLSITTLSSFAQTTHTFNNQSVIVRNPNVYPWGVNINFDYSAGRWGREFNISYNGTGNLFSFGAVADGPVLDYGYIGGNNQTDGINASYPWMTFKPNGNIGIGSLAPKARLEIFNTPNQGHLILSANDNQNAELTRINIDFHVADQNHTVGRIASYYSNSANGGSGGLKFFMRKEGNLIETLSLNSAGNEVKVDVMGTLRANEIIVESLGADFVFADDYHLRPLKELEEFIIENKHLPEVAPAESMAKNGMEVGEMQVILLQKIEELTLYIIDLEKKYTKLQEDFDKQNREK
ncbi:MAG: hypothetical protein LBQ60_06265 [Bacteroidales bacterium]|jgi:hypothetical protein|nr:hypothetical protein [Bacteroidales bacterium]